MLALMHGLGFTVDATAGDPTLRHVVKKLATRVIPGGTAENLQTT